MQPEADALRAPAPTLAETVSLGVVLGLALAALAMSHRYPLWEYFQPGPGLFPAIAAGLSALCAVGALAAALAARRRGAAEPGERPEWRRLLVYVVVVLLWTLTFQAAGFVLSSLVALTLLLRVGESMTWVLSLILGGVTVGLGWAVFDKLLGVPLPHGLLP